MSINHYYSSDLPEAHWWPQQQYMMDTKTSSTSNFPTSTAAAFYHHNSAAAAMFNLNNEDEEELIDEQQTTDERDNTSNNITSSEHEIPKEPLFEKPLTPSDVGKLNRLVIPKQHAEKYFPLNGGVSGEKGLLLGFEDEIGKSWRFRYSYWNSSQSYVLTKGWSRFVKEKRLDAGDIVLFKRHRVDAARLFIGWRRRNSEQDSGVAQPSAAVATGGVAGGGGGGWSRMFYSYPSQHQAVASALPYQSNCVNAGSVVQNQTSGASGNPKRLRLFGVNLECQADESEPCTPDGSPMSSQGQAHQHPYYQYYSNNHMDHISFSGGGAGGDHGFHRQR
ncbi:hypothetical protein BUALT_Bualt09G0097700 [Buddleja alternifolia]|uniref:TF-B3 domain-containing protein n=1 Tax=Buddleja alternifolia TaxID=168488 RepID=A0AAV6X300_9LAMI|nr:hypothetical protein BUALT_Bualt09G0097700 [Buddleja alternifolia]